MKMYAVNSKDIRYCPNSNCSYFGIIKEKVCRETYNCPICTYEWRDKINFTVLENMSNKIRKMNESKNTILCDIYEGIFTEKCPNCYIPIYKNGGCMHMTCQKCHYEFCWMCKQSNDYHNDWSCFWGIYSKIIFLIFAGWHFLSVLIPGFVGKTLQVC
jgi:hypothetical protein